MSTKDPINTTPGQCTTNWLTALICRVQRVVEPLCQMSLGFALDVHEQNAILADLAATNRTPGLDSVAHRTPQQWLLVIEVGNLVMSEHTAKILAPRLTIMNRIGVGAWKLFSTGTECSCCWGLRLIALAVFWFLIGYIIKG